MYIVQWYVGDRGGVPFFLVTQSPVFPPDLPFSPSSSPFPFWRENMWEKQRRKARKTQRKERGGRRRKLRKKQEEEEDEEY